jgi:2-keto-4-pentenoate hydratase/2-oxohepta-3-ene-1,7-dioic acid hydratase in catechol pathway
LKNNKNFWLPNFSTDIQYEAEVVFRIGRVGRCIQERFAYRYIDAFCLGIDVTARDLQMKCRNEGLPWEISKCFDGSAIISKFIPINNVDHRNINFSLFKNTVKVQDGNTSGMIFDIYKIITYISQFMTLKIGDMIFTGTPAGVGKLEIGDHIVGVVENTECINMKIK